MEPVKIVPPNHKKCSDPTCGCHRVDIPVYNFYNPPTSTGDPQQDSFLPPKRNNLFYRILRAVLPSLIALSVCLKIRAVVIDELKKVIDCGNPEKGGSFLVCPGCGEQKFVPFTCKSRFCPSCGNLYNMQRLSAVSDVLFDVSHYHITFTFDERLRRYFLIDHDALNDLFDAARETLLDYYMGGLKDLDTTVHKRGKKKRKNKRRKIYIPGIILVLHTFGRDLKWNPHIHVLCTKCALDENDVWHEFKFISYTYLHKVFMYKIIAKLRKRFKSKDFHKLTNQIIKDHPDGFHVHVDDIDKVETDPKEDSSLKKVMKYIGRYLGRPPIAMSRIDQFDEDTHMVTFHYLPHEPHEELGPGEPMYETLHMLCFALRLIRHIPEPQFKMIRYAGIYSTVRQRSMPRAFKKQHLLFKSGSHAKRQLFSHWRGAYYRAYRIDPVECPNCHKIMERLYIRIGKEKYWIHKKYPPIPWSQYKNI